IWMRLLPPDDATDVIQEAPEEQRPKLLALLDEYTLHEVVALLAYAEDAAGGLMSPRFARLRPEMTVDEAIAYLRRQAEQVETIHYAYVLDSEQHLLGIVPLRRLMSAHKDQTVREVMRTDFVAASEEIEQEIARAVVLALFIPLIISSGGNSGSQATSLVIRAMALGEVRLRDWWRVVRREVGAGFALGCMLGSIGMMRILVWQTVKPGLY